MERALSDSAQWKQWSLNGIEAVSRHFSWDNHVRNYLSTIYFFVRSSFLIKPKDLIKLVQRKIHYHHCQ